LPDRFHADHGEFFGGGEQCVLQAGGQK
jgi:hypothetical protein